MSCRETYIVTLQFDAASFDWLQELRIQHFPPQRNFLPAHLTMLHTASLDQVNRLKQSWRSFNRITALPILFSGLRSLGGGTAVVVRSPNLNALRITMMQAMGGEFSKQDQQHFKAHVTIQNKVDPATAQSLLERLSANFVPRGGTGEGLMVWRYLGGPWSLKEVMSFDSAGV